MVRLEVKKKVPAGDIPSWTILMPFCCQACEDVGSGTGCYCSSRSFFAWSVRNGFILEYGTVNVGIPSA